MQKSEKKICKHCKEEILKNAKKCPYCGGSQGLPTIAKALIVIGIVLLLIGGCVKGCTDTLDESVKETTNSYKDINGKTSFKLNEPFQNSYEKITMTEVNTNFTDYGEFDTPSEGKKYVMAKFEIENTNKENDELYVSSIDFNADADGVSVETAYIGNDKYNDFSATVGKGKKTIGYVFYEVPVNATKINIEYNADFWSDGTSIEFIVQE